MAPFVGFFIDFVKLNVLIEVVIDTVAYVGNYIDVGNKKRWIKSRPIIWRSPSSIKKTELFRCNGVYTMTGE